MNPGLLPFIWVKEESKSRKQDSVCAPQQRTILFTALFSSMGTLKFKAQPTNVFFAAINQMFISSLQLLTTDKPMVIKSLSTVHTMKTVLGSSQKLGGPVKHLNDGSEKPIFITWALNLTVHMLLKGEVKEKICIYCFYHKHCLLNSFINLLIY